ncbi:hypothetical protein BDV96DRAFT_647072 [Lophiotrema nucula]|uniref:Uncharacterized protein n=1 Tax=Lophiotrema nucula TaxID=690887 RepID=A0A6A5Z5Q3_9PLEO|nr:hypothetical protein BDV96DRAFT_647072 [Lophiotrema nucula]
MSFIDLTQESPPRLKKSKKVSKERRLAMPRRDLSSPEPELQKVKIERGKSEELGVHLNLQSAIDALVTVPEGLEASAVEDVSVDVIQGFEADGTIHDDENEDDLERRGAVDDSRVHDVQDEDVEEESESELMDASEPIVIDPEGDLVIVAGDKRTGVERFLVNSAWLRSIKSWNDYLDAHPPTLDAVQAADHGDHSVLQVVHEMTVHDTSMVESLEEHRISHHLSEERELLEKVSVGDLTFAQEIQYPNLDNTSVELHTELELEDDTHETNRPTHKGSGQGDSDSALQADIEAQSGKLEQRNTRQSLSGWYTAELLKLDGDGANIQLDQVVEPLALSAGADGPDIPPPRLDLELAKHELVQETRDSDATMYSVQGAPAGDLDQSPEGEANEPADAPAMPVALPVHLDEEVSAVGMGIAPRFPEVCLPGAIPEAVGIMLSVIHLRMDLLPPAIDFDTIYNLAVLCEKFDMENLLGEQAIPWVHRLLPHALESGSIHWMYVAWVFKFPELFEAHLQHLACTSIIVDGRLDVHGIDARSGDHLVDLVTGTREQLLQDIVDVVAKYVDETYWNRNFRCKVDHTMNGCREHAYIAVAVKMRVQGLWPSLPAVSSIRKSPAEVREDIHDFEITPYSADHADCLDLVHQFKNEILFVPYRKQSVKMKGHFQTPVDIGETRLSSLMGSHLYNYGFAPQDFGYTSFVQSRKRRRHLDLSNKRGNGISGRLLLEDELSDDPDSDYSLPSDSEDEVDELFTRDDATAALADLEGRQPPAKKRARHNQASKARQQEDIENLYDFGFDE